MSKHMFYVAMSTEYPGTASASCVDGDKKLVKDFYRDYVGREIRHVDGDEMMRLTNAFLDARQKAARCGLEAFIAEDTGGTG